ncbi:GGDEF domain-containing protein [Aestuariibius sp. HNIBRBA575]|uniref:GGDEF domain-containing protein n=1 Tax=Aestuariibius sp. HNIBRBA575 TaxID=3233343 RepID=UPI0034A1532D
MERLIAIVTPSSWLHWWVSFAVLLVSICLASLGIRAALFGIAEVEVTRQIIEALVIGIPYVFVAQWGLQHLKSLQDKLAVLATTDMLTGLPNRRAFMQELSDRQDQNTADYVMMLDVDHFKRINDTFGHDVGDICLSHLADELRNIVRSEDVVARMGGEEFAVILSQVSKETAIQIGERIAQGTHLHIRDHPEHVNLTELDPQHRLKVTVSVGACRPKTGDSPKSILRRADAAMYHAKRSGRAQLIIHQKG